MLCVDLPWFCYVFLFLFFIMVGQGGREGVFTYLPYNYVVSQLVVFMLVCLVCLIDSGAIQLLQSCLHD